MPFFIKTVIKETHLKYLVEADSAEEALEKEGGVYMGCIDVDSDKEAEISDAFATEDELREDSESYVMWQ